MKRLSIFLRPLFSTILLATLLCEAGAQKQSGKHNPLTNRVVVLFPPPGERYELRSGDLLSFRMFGRPELASDRLRIDERGMINLPLIGEVKAAGRAVKELRSELVLLYRKYEKYPKVYLNPLEIRNPVRVYAEYDDMGRELSISTGPMYFDEAKLALLQIRHTGGEDVVLVFSPAEAYAEYELTAWLDGKERINLNLASKQSQRVYPVHGEWLELKMKVPIKSLTRITSATEVKMRLGVKEFQLKEQDLEAIRFLVGHRSKAAAP